MKEIFLVSPLATENPVILGMPWFAKPYPQVDWRTRNVKLRDDTTIQSRVGRESLAKPAICKILTPKEVRRALAGEENNEAWLLSVQVECVAEISCMHGLNRNAANFGKSSPIF